MAVLSYTHVRVYRRTSTEWNLVQYKPINGAKDRISMTEDGLWFAILNYAGGGMVNMWLNQVSRTDGEMIPYEMVYNCDVVEDGCWEWENDRAQISLTTISNDSVEVLVFEEIMGARLLQYQHGSTTWTEIDSTEGNEFLNISGLDPYRCDLQLVYRLSHRQLIFCSDVTIRPPQHNYNSLMEGCFVKGFIFGEGWIESLSDPGTAYGNVQIASNGAVAVLQEPFSYNETTPTYIFLHRQSQPLQDDSAAANFAVWENHDAYPQSQAYQDRQMLLTHDGTKVLVATRGNCGILKSIALYQLPW